MAAVLAPRKSEIGWIMDIPPEMAEIMKVAPGSFVLLYPKEGGMETEILPAPSEELLEDFERMFEKYGETFEVLKQLGD